jgi:hypothetical protein
VFLKSIHSLAEEDFLALIQIVEDTFDHKPIESALRVLGRVSVNPEKLRQQIYKKGERTEIVEYNLFS